APAARTLIVALAALAPLVAAGSALRALALRGVGFELPLGGRLVGPVGGSGVVLLRPAAVATGLGGRLRVVGGTATVDRLVLGLVGRVARVAAGGLGGLSGSLRSGRSAGDAGQLEDQVDDVG